MRKCSEWTISSCALLVALFLLVGCGGGDQTACTTEARPSVFLRVVDENGAGLADVSVSYQVDAGEIQVLSCGATGECNIAFEVRGTFAIAAEKPGYPPASAEVTVSGDVCHVETQQLTLVLLPSL